MIGTRRQTTRRSPLAALVAVLAVLLIGGGLTACESNPAELDAVREAVNASRADAGLRPLAPNLALNIKADRWAQTMRNECRIWHSDLADGAPAGWRKLGENVGMGANVGQIHTAYMNSPGHRANVLDASFNQIGTAAVWGECPWRGRTLFTVHVFMRT